MISVFIQEQKRYHLSDLSSLFNLSKEKTILIVRKLKEVGIVKAVNSLPKYADLEGSLEEDLVITDKISFDNDLCYIFNFVGIIIIYGLLINCYPKYIQSTNRPVREFKQVLKVLEKYLKRTKEMNFYDQNSPISSYNRLALYLFLIEDYFENGIYTSDYITQEINGSGEVDWNQTINRDSSFIDQNIPYYYELITRRRVTNENDFVKQLHEIILTKISQELDKEGLLELFDLPDIYLSKRELEDLGDTNFIIYKLEKKLNEEFNTRKKLVILALITFLNQEIKISDINSISIFGTNNFNLVWEDVCQVILNNHLYKELHTLDLPKPLSQSLNKRGTLYELIEKPFWVYTGKFAANTLIPDIVSIESFKKSSYFIIYDAKYYTAILEPDQSPRRQPGIESIVKQYFYQLAFKSFIIDHGFDFVKNFFILPTEGKEVIEKKQVRLETLKKIGLEDIEVRLLPAEIAYKYYLEDKKFNLDLLKI